MAREEYSSIKKKNWFFLLIKGCKLLQNVENLQMKEKELFHNFKFWFSVNIWVYVSFIPLFLSLYLVSRAILYIRLSNLSFLSYYL